ncbi:hypothetical protein HN803_03775 [candidate division WWE3 bacterium]|jgi:hypothetical protein|nr:hypothetical protein [candidate division WWE3 bacterium]
MDKSCTIIACFLVAIAMGMMGLIYSDLWSIGLSEEGHRAGRHIFPPVIAVVTAFVGGMFAGSVDED